MILTMAIEGVDYSFARPSPLGLKNAGKKFAVRYGGPGTSGKWLTAGELAALRAVGIDVVANAEGTAGGYRGTAVGRDWASSADGYFRALGMPADRPIYFSVDFAADAADWASIDAALRGSAAVIGAARVGVYGSYDTIEHCRAAGTAAWFWQTYAWSGGRQHPAAHLYQYQNGVTVGGGDCDLTRALVDDYGQWGYQGGDMPINDADLGRIWGYPVGKSGLSTVQTLQNTFSNSGNVAAIAAAVAALQATTSALLANVVADDNDKAAIMADAAAKHADLMDAVSRVDDEVWAKVPDPGVPVAEKAALLRAVLGGDSAAVGRILAGS
jgi:hypothetical protein